MTTLVAETHASLQAAERRAWRTMMNGSEADARTVFGEEGKNYVAWCKAADKLRAWRVANDVRG